MYPWCGASLSPVFHRAGALVAGILNGAGTWAIPVRRQAMRAYWIKRSFRLEWSFSRSCSLSSSLQTAALYLQE
ncbi:hypothetical protein IHE45_19G150400 [Dioscorea alata]|uniref:Uncharacterized protein n=2 Tax=Dioscorea alata TaxID=55571 RepID=A0ACB7U2Q3_DIOAL|nr:hypothetical protein IHE45_19G150400 [Dioscorea alata]KAH7654558.1 hypothetical protein IHE45_19G150400 [Dioscorea alata]